MNEHKRPMSRTGMVGMLLLLGSIATAAFLGTWTFVTLLVGILGFILLEHQESVLSFLKRPEKEEP